MLPLGFAKEGELIFEGHENIKVLYNYSLEKDNMNDRTLSRFSTDAVFKMRACGNCEYYVEFSRFSQFYGKLDYAHQWVNAAIMGTRTVFDASTADFENLSPEARAGMSTIISTTS